MLTPLWVWHLQLCLGCHTQQALLTAGSQLKPSQSGYKPYSAQRVLSSPGCSGPLSHPRVNAAFRLAANGGEGGSWRTGVLPCRPGLYHQRFLQEISLLNQLLHQTPEEQQSDSALKHECASALSAADAMGRTVYLTPSMEIKLKNKNIHLKTQKRKISAC